MDLRPRVSRLHRLDQQDGELRAQYPAFWYYTPDGHIIGPFDTAEEREADLAAYFNEV